MLKCNKCGKMAVTAVDSGDTPLCAYHFVIQEDDICLRALLMGEIYEKGKVTECKEIQMEIKKEKPKIYEDFMQYFDI